MPVILSFLCTVLLTPAITKMAGGFNSPIKEELLETHAQKAGTCQLGSIAIVAGFALGALVSRDEVAVLSLLLALPFFVIGLIDDARKYVRHYSDGLSSLSKLALQLAASVFVAYVLKDRIVWSLPVWLYWPFVVIFTSASVNALNITDGLDSLAVKASMPALVLVAVACPLLRRGNLIMLAVLAAYLVYNSHRASIFMGDGGSHFIGAFLSLDALLSGNIAGVMLALFWVYLELLSSFVQIVSIRAFNRKVLLIAPLHHDLEKRGLGEEKITDLVLSLSIFSSLLSAILVFKVV